MYLRRLVAMCFRATFSHLFGQWHSRKTLIGHTHSHICLSPMRCHSNCLQLLHFRLLMAWLIWRDVHTATQWTLVIVHLALFKREWLVDLIRPSEACKWRRIVLCHRSRSTLKWPLLMPFELFAVHCKWVHLPQSFYSSLRPSLSLSRMAKMPKWHCRASSANGEHVQVVRVP